MGTKHPGRRNQEHTPRQGTIGHATKSLKGRLQRPGHTCGTQEPNKAITEPKPTDAPASGRIIPINYLTSTSLSPSDLPATSIQLFNQPYVCVQYVELRPKAHWQRAHPATAASIGSNDQEPPGRSLQPMHTAQTHAKDKPTTRFPPAMG